MREKVEVREGEEEDKARKQQTLKHVMTCACVSFLSDTRCDTLSHNVMCAQNQKCREKLSCEVFLSTPPVGYSGSLTTGNETNCNKKNSDQSKNSYELISNSIQTCPTTMCLKRDGIDCIDLDG